MVRYAEDLSLMMRIMCRSEETRKKFEQKVADTLYYEISALLNSQFSRAVP